MACLFIGGVKMGVGDGLQWVGMGWVKRRVREYSLIMACCRKQHSNTCEKMTPPQEQFQKC